MESLLLEKLDELAHQPMLHVDWLDGNEDVLPVGHDKAGRAGTGSREGKSFYF